jgi:uncharacterized protein (DUF362 family)
MSEDSLINRRDFLKRTARVGGIAVASAGLGFWLHDRGTYGRAESPVAQIRDFSVTQDVAFPQLVIARGELPPQITKAAIDGLGGIEKFISRGDIVVVKPNVGWDRIPQQAANTNPEVVKTIIELCYNAGAKKVVVTDVSCNEARRCFMRSGIAEAAESVGAYVELPEDRKFRELNLGGEVLSTRQVYTTFIEADKVINVPIAKHHNLTGATLAMKNWYGILGGRRNQLHQHIHESIADLGTFFRPTLTILDAFRVLMRNGPQGGNVSDVAEMKTIVASIDQVAIDAYAGETFFGLTPERLRYLRIAHERKIGNMNYRELRIKEVAT